MFNADEMRCNQSFCHHYSKSIKKYQKEQISKAACNKNVEQDRLNNNLCANEVCSLTSHSNQASRVKSFVSKKKFLNLKSLY